MEVLVFVLVSTLCFIILSNIKFGKKMSAAEKNLRRIAEKASYNTISEQQLKDSFDKRMKMFLEEKIDTFLISKQKVTKTETLERLVRKVYKDRKTYKTWEYERILLVIMLFLMGMLAYALIPSLIVIAITIIAPIFVYYLFEIDLKSDAKKRDWENFVFFPNVLMYLSMLYNVGAVSGIFQGFKKAAETYNHPLVDELSKAVVEYEYNKDKYDVLVDLAKRLDFKEFTSFVNLVIETEKNNVPIVETLTEYAYEISDKRRILASNEMDKVPEKMDIIMFFVSGSVCFIYMVLPSLSLAVEQLMSVGVL